MKKEHFSVGLEAYLWFVGYLKVAREAEPLAFRPQFGFWENRYNLYF